MTIFRVAMLIVMCGLAASFQTKISSLKNRPQVVLLSMTSDDNYELIGALPPVGLFDPLNLLEGKTGPEIKKFREAELKHGRLAMIATLGIFVGESGFKPFFNGEITGPAIYQFQQADAIFSNFWLIVVAFIAFVETQNISNGWESSEESRRRPNGVALLRDDYVNGDLGFDPLKLKPADADAFDLISTKELQNGRLAMIGVSGIIAQELVTGKGVFESLFG